MASRSSSKAPADGATAAGNGPSGATLRQKRAFRENFARNLRESGLSLAELRERTGIDLPTLRRWRREGVAQPKHSHIERLAAVFRLRDPWSLMAERPPGPPTAIDRATNPMVDEARGQRPELFQDFTDDDWAELYSMHGVGGPLTYDGAIEAAAKINRKRDLRRMFESLLETDHFETLASLIELMYRDSSLE
jgi:transcriptional regulator with XRE-family HTH domain